jgi:DNA gyrase subunit A
VRDGKIEGIGADLRDESDREGMRIVVELSAARSPASSSNQLYKHTPMQSSFGVILLSIVHGQPRILSLREMLQLFLDHRKEVVTRRTRLRAAQGRRARAYLGGA